MNNILITGATSGLGLELAKQFLDSGKNVHIFGRNRAAIEDLLGNPRCHFSFIDLQDGAKLSPITKYLQAHDIDCFINNAGIYSDKGLSISTEECHSVVMVNLFSAILLLRDAYEFFRTRGKGTIAVIDSIAGLTPNFKESVYAASKHGLKGFVGSLQMEAYKYNIKIMEYYLGAMQTPMTATRPGYAELMKPQEVANSIISDIISPGSLLAVRQEIRKFQAIKSA